MKAHLFFLQSGVCKKRLVTVPLWIVSARDFVLEATIVLLSVLRLIEY
jgi:hypothetical protein